MADQFEHAGDMVWIRLATAFQVRDDRVVEKAVAIPLDLGVVGSQLREMPQDDTSRQLGLTIVAVIDTGGSDGCPPEPFGFGPIASPLRSERLDAVPLKVRQRTKMLLEL